LQMRRIPDGSIHTTSGSRVHNTIRQIIIRISAGKEVRYITMQDGCANSTSGHSYECQHVTPQDLVIMLR
jgi:hypothetical protein